MLGWIIKTVNVLVGGIIYNDKFDHIADTIKDLGKSCDQLGIQYLTKLSTLEVTVSQQAIQIKKLKEELEEHTLTDESLILQYTGGTKTPEPHPYTHPIREVPESGKVKVKNG